MRPQFIRIFLFMPLVAAADSPAPAPSAHSGVCETPPLRSVWRQGISLLPRWPLLLRSARPPAPRGLSLLASIADRDQAKRPEMGKIAAARADLAIITDDNPRGEDPAVIRAAIAEGAPGARIIGDRRAAIAAAPSAPRKSRQPRPTPAAPSRFARRALPRSRREVEIQRGRMKGERWRF